MNKFSIGDTVIRINGQRFESSGSMYGKVISVNKWVQIEGEYYYDKDSKCELINWYNPDYLKSVNSIIKKEVKLFEFIKE